MAKFSKAHYLKLAEVFKKTAREHDPKSEFGLFNLMRLNLLEMLEKDNPKFDWHRFLRASEPEEWGNR